jgi:preprotein translocase subunit SecF
MQLFPVGKVYDFMKRRHLFIGLSLFISLASLVLLVYPGPKLGTDFKGGTEIEIAFTGQVDAEQITQAVQKHGFSKPDVIRVEDLKNPNHYLVRVEDVSTIDEGKREEIENKLCHGEPVPVGCTPEHVATEVKVSPGGDKITARFEAEPDLEWIRDQVSGVGGIKLRPGANNPSVQNQRDHKVEIALLGKGDQLMDALRQELGVANVPDAALRTEWIGPKAGAQLRDAAIKSVAITLFFIMAYVAFRFDLRFAPGTVLSLAHDAIGTVGILIVLGKELNLTTLAAVLTIIGYSVSDTVVVYDRVRENLGRLRGASFTKLINVSISEMFGRTLISSGTVLFSLICFFVWGTGSLKDFALTLVIGVLLGVYSSIYVALPLTEWLDRKFFSQFARKGGRKPAAA